MKLVNRSLFLLLFASCTVSQNQRLEEYLAPSVKAFDLKNMHFALEALDDPAGSFSLTLAPLKPIAERKKSFPIYALRADGLPLHERFLLVSFDPLKKIATPLFEFEALEDQTLRLTTNQGDTIMEEAPVIIKDFLKGQTIYLAAISKERNTCNIATIIPSPIETTIDDAAFSLIPTHRKGTHFRLEGKGLVPGEAVLITSGSELKQRQSRLMKKVLFPFPSSRLFWASWEDDPA